MPVRRSERLRKKREKANASVAVAVAAVPTRTAAGRSAAGRIAPVRTLPARAASVRSAAGGAGAGSGSGVVRGPPLRLLRGRERTQRQLEEENERISDMMATRSVIDAGVALYGQFLRTSVYSNVTDFDDEEDDEPSLRLTAFFIRIALLESPSLAELTRRNPSQGIRKLCRVIRFLFFRD